jgi:hypothetical protein
LVKEIAVSKMLSKIKRRWRFLKNPRKGPMNLRKNRFRLNYPRSLVNHLLIVNRFDRNQNL